MHIKLTLIAIALLIIISAQSQYKNDNVLFKTVDPSDLCTTLKNQKDYVLIDVRSKGEYYDTSAFGLNLGHLKGAINIDIRELGKRLNEIKQYQDRPVFVYCSHSQRSRRAGKLLADSGFNKIFNINGGMSALYYNDAIKDTCVRALVESANKYKIISANTLCSLLAKDNSPEVIDVRTDSAFRHISLNPAENAHGTIKGSVNIPLTDLEQKISSIPKNREIVITDLFGDESAKAANILMQKGYTDVSVLIEGIDRIIYTDEKDLPCKKIMYQPSVNYDLMNVAEFGRYAQQNKDFVLLDIRSKEEFSNTHKDSWRNIGHLKNAINIANAELAQRFSEIGTDKNKQIIIYAFGSGAEAHAAAHTLKQNGYKNLHVIVGGIFNLRWAAANNKNNGWLKEFVTDVPEVNL